MAGMGERLGTPEAVLRVQRFPAPAVDERLPGGTHRAVVARVLEHATAALDGGVRLLGAGHRVVHGGEQFSSSILVNDAADRRVALVQSPGAAAQPGESRRHRGRARRTARLAASRRVRHRVSSHDAAARFPLCSARGVVHAVRRATLRISRHQPSVRQPAGSRTARPAARRAPAGHRPSRQRMQRGRRARRSLGGHHHGAHPAGRSGDGDPLRRRGSRPSRLPRRPDRQEPGRAHHGAQYRQRAAGASGRRQRHAHGRGRGCRGK